jgi:hypothetical protein
LRIDEPPEIPTTVQVILVVEELFVVPMVGTFGYGGLLGIRKYNKTEKKIKKTTTDE